MKRDELGTTLIKLQDLINKLNKLWKNMDVLEELPIKVSFSYESEEEKEEYETNVENSRISI